MPPDIAPPGCTLGKKSLIPSQAGPDRRLRSRPSENVTFVEAPGETTTALTAPRSQTSPLSELNSPNKRPLANPGHFPVQTLGARGPAIVPSHFVFTNVVRGLSDFPAILLVVHVTLAFCKEITV